MEYNKNKFTKVNDHKVLHKVKKQWIVMSMAMLALLGGGAVAHKVSAHAAVTNQNNATLRNRLNQDLQLTNQGAQASRSQNQLTNNHTYRKPTNDGRQITNVISQQARTLHNRIILNANLNRNNDSNNQQPQQNNQAQIDLHNVQTTSNRNNQTDLGHHNFKTMNAPQNSVGTTNYSAVDSHNITFQKHDHNGWGTANLTLYSDGLLYLSDGTLESDHGHTNSQYGNKSDSGSLYDDGILSNRDIPKINSIKIHNVHAPQNSSHLFTIDFYTNYDGDNPDYNTHVNTLSNIDLNDGFYAPDNVNMSDMFRSDSINSMNIDNFDTSRVQSMHDMFSDADISHLTLGNKFDTSQVQDMSGMFNNAGLTSLDLGDHFDTSNVKSMKDMFNENESLKHLTLGNHFSTSRVQDMSGMFNETGLTSLNLGDRFDTSDVKSMNSMFNEDNSLKHLALGNHFNTSQVQDMSSMFNDTGLSNLDLGSYFDTSNVKSMNDMFADNSAWDSLNLGDHFDTSQVRNMSGMFKNDKVLSSLDLKNSFDTAQVTDMDQMFQNDVALNSLNLENHFDTSRVTSMSDMFESDKSLGSLDLKDKFDTSRVTNMNDMFKNDGALTSLNLGDYFQTAQVTSMSGMFESDNFTNAGYSKLYDLDLGPNFVIGSDNSLNNIPGLFKNDRKLESVDLSHFIGAGNADGLFTSDYNLHHINISSLNINGYRYIEHDATAPDDMQSPYSYYDMLLSKERNDNSPSFLNILTLGNNQLFECDGPRKLTNSHLDVNNLEPDGSDGSIDVSLNRIFGNNFTFNDVSDEDYYGADYQEYGLMPNTTPIEYYPSNNQQWSDLRNLNDGDHYGQYMELSNVVSNINRSGGITLYHRPDFVDGTWFNITPSDKLQILNRMTDDMPHPGTWLRSVDQNTVVYVDQDHKIAGAKGYKPTFSNPESSFDTWMRNHALPTGYTLNRNADNYKITKFRNTNNTSNEPSYNYVGVVHVISDPAHGRVPIKAVLENRDGSFNRNDYSDAYYNYSDRLNDTVSDITKTSKGMNVPQTIGGNHGAYVLQSFTPTSTSGRILANAKSGPSDNFPSTFDWSGGNDPVAVYKFVPGYAGNIVLNYINQSGLPVDYGSSVNHSADGIDDPTYSSDIINGNHRYGDELNVLNPHNKRPYSAYGYPNPDSDDYKVDRNGINSDYTFGINQQYVTVPLTGKPTSNPNNHSQSQSDGNNAVKINVFTKGHQGDYQQTYTTTVHLNGRIGSLISLKPSDLLNSNSPFYYDRLKDDNSHQKLNLAHYVIGGSYSFKQYYLHGNGNQSATLYNTVNGRPTTSAENPSPANVNFYYDASPDYSTGVKPVTVRYINQHNHQVGNSDVITPTPSDYGREINVTNSDSRLNSQNGKTAHGMNVPNGYRLVDDSDVDYRITDQPQEADLYVRGDQEQINNGSNNYALPIHIVANVYKSDGTTPDKTTTIQDTVSDGQGHSKQFTSNVDQTFTPTLVGNVGDSDVISAASYQPRISSNQMVESTGTNKYTVRFKQPQPNQSDISVDGVSNPTSNGITFNYKIVDKPTVHQRNYIHYISYSDVDNRGDITTQPSHSAFKTQVSDASYSDQTFNDKYYRENVPKGYQFYKVYSVNGNTNDSQISGGLNQFGNGQFGDGHGPGEEYIEVIPNASPITFHYINQNGSDVKDVQVSGNGSQKNAASGESNYTSNFGTKITSNQINKSDQPTSQLGVPQGYQYNALTDSQGKSTTIGETQPVFGRDPQNVYIPVTGKTYNKVNVQLQQDFSGTNHQKFANSDYIYTINNAQVGHNYTIYGVNLKTPSAAAGSGYTLDQSGHPFKVTVHINPDNSYSFLNSSDDAGGQAETSNNNGSDSDTISVNTISDIKDNKNNNQIQFNPSTGNLTATKPPKASFWYHITNNISKPLTLIYINQAGQQVGCADKMQGTVGSDINVTDPSKGGEPVPSDYQLDGGTNKGSDGRSDITGNNQDTEYRFTNQPRTVYLHVTGKTPEEAQSPQITVYTVAKNSDGTTTFGHQTSKVEGPNGSLVSVNPSDYYPDEVNDKHKDGSKSKYSIDYSKDSTQFVRIGENQDKRYVATPNRLIFYYSNKTTDGAPITLRYINHKTGQEVGYTKVINGNLSDKVDVTSSDPTNGDLAGEDVPAGYNIDTSDLLHNNLLSGSTKGQPVVYKFSDSPQMLNIPVNGKSDTLTYHIHVFKESSDGTIQGPASDVALHITGNVGDTIHISPYGFTSSNAGNNGSDIKSMSDNNNSINSYGVPTGGSGYHATNTDLDKDIQINANGQLSPDSNTNYFYRQNYQGQQVGTVRIHYITDSSISAGAVNSTTGKPNDGSEVDEVSDKGTVGNDYTHAGTFDLSPYRDDIPEELSTNYESADNAMNKDGTQIADNPSGNQWQYSENNNGFTNGIRDVYIQVKQRSTNGVSNGPIIIGSDGNMLNQ